MPQLQTRARQSEVPEILKDILGFVGESLTEFAARQKERQKLGSRFIKGRANERESQEFVRQAAEEASSFTPAGVIRGISSKAQKKIVTSIARKAPELLKQLQESPMTVSMHKFLPVNRLNAGEFQAAIPHFGQVAIHPNLFRGRDPFGQFGNAFGDLPLTAIHESQHALNVPRVLSTSPEDAAQAATLISEFLPTMLGRRQVAGELSGIVPNPNVASTRALTQNEIYSARAYNEALAYLRELYASGKASPEAAALARALFGVK